LQDDYYFVSQKNQKTVRAFVHVSEDSIHVVDNAGEPISIIKNTDIHFIKRSFDVDLLAVPFKFRPSASGFPQQLNSNVNGNVMLGYRIDRFNEHFTRTPAGVKKSIRHRGFAAGVFGGFGATFVSPWTTASQITDEYDGVVVTRGVTVLAGINSLTVGLGVGWDYLTDRNKNIWIYQNKPWLGLTIGLNLN
jgi:hypothetical protein